MRRAIVVFFLSVLLTAAAYAEITVVGPTEPINAGDYAFLQVTGLSQADLVKASVTVEPSGPLLMPLQDWSGKPMLFFSSRKEGSFTVSVSLNAWSAAVDQSYQVVKSAPIEKQDEPLRQAYLTSSAALTAAYRADVGTCSIVVGDDDPPPPPAESLTGVMLYNSEDRDNQPEVSKIVVSTRLRALEKFKFYPYDVATQDQDNEPPDNLAPWMKLVRDNNWPLPQLLLINDQGDLVNHGSPANVDAAIKLVKENLK